MKKSNPTQKNPSQTADDTDLATALSAPDASLDTVRDILFGAQIRDSEKQRDALAQQLKNMIDELTNATNKRFDTLQNTMQTMRSELDSTSEKNTDEFNSKLDSLDQTLSQSIKELDKATSSAEAELADQIDSNINTLNTQMENWKDDLSSRLDQIHKQLTHDKTDRSTLAELFAGISEQLMNDKPANK